MDTLASQVGIHRQSSIQSTSYEENHRLRKITAKVQYKNLAYSEEECDYRVEKNWHTGLKADRSYKKKMFSSYSISNSKRADGWKVIDLPTKKKRIYKSPDGEEFSSQRKAKEYAADQGIPFDGVTRGKRKHDCNLEKSRKKQKQQTDESVGAESKQLMDSILVDRRNNKKHSMRAKILQEKLTQIGKMITQNRGDSDNELLRLHHEDKVNQLNHRNAESIQTMRTKRCKTAEESILSTVGSVDEAARTYVDLLKRPIGLAMLRHCALHDVSDAGLKSSFDTQLVDNAVNLINKLQQDVTHEGVNYRSAVITSLVSTDSLQKRNITRIAKRLRSTRRLVDRCVKKRSRVIADSKWIVDKKSGRNLLWDEPAIALLREYLHSDQASREDNSNKKVLDIKIILADGSVVIEKHTIRKLMGNKTELWVKLTGTTWPDGKTTSAGPHRIWLEIQTLRPGIKGNPNVLDKAMCRCLRHGTIGMCDCPHCTHFEFNLNFWNQRRTQWRSTALKNRRTLLRRQVARAIPAMLVKAAEHVSVSRVVAIQLLRCENWLWRKLVVLYTGPYDCDCSGGACRGLWRSFSRNTETFVNALVCPPVILPDVEMRTLNPVTHLEEGPMIQSKLRKKECRSGDCTVCGWSRVFGNLPAIEVPEYRIGEHDAKTHGGIVHACTMEIEGMQECRWMEFIQVWSKQFKENGDKRFVNWWVPAPESAPATRLQFVHRLQKLWEIYNAHMYGVKLMHLTRARQRRILFERPACGIGPRLRNFAEIWHDYASSFTHSKSHTLNSSFNESSKLWVSTFNIITLCAKHQTLYRSPHCHKHNMHTTYPYPKFLFLQVGVMSYNCRRESIPEEQRLRRRKVNRKFTHVLTRDCVVFYAYSKRKPDAVFTGTCLLLMTAIAKTGRIHDEWGTVGVEAFMDGKRLIGSDQSLPLPLPVFQPGIITSVLRRGSRMPKWLRHFVTLTLVSAGVMDVPRKRKGCTPLKSTKIMFTTPTRVCTITAPLHTTARIAQTQ